MGLSPSRPPAIFFINGAKAVGGQVLRRLWFTLLLVGVGRRMIFGAVVQKSGFAETLASLLGDNEKPHAKALRRKGVFGKNHLEPIAEMTAIRETLASLLGNHENTKGRKHEKQGPERVANLTDLKIPHRAFRVFVLSCFRDEFCVLGHSNPIMMLQCPIRFSFVFFAPSRLCVRFCPTPILKCRFAKCICEKCCCGGVVG